MPPPPPGAASLTPSARPLALSALLLSTLATAAFFWVAGAPVPSLRDRWLAVSAGEGACPVHRSLARWSFVDFLDGPYRRLHQAIRPPARRARSPEPDDREREGWLLVPCAMARPDVHGPVRLADAPWRLDVDALRVPGPWFLWGGDDLCAAAVSHLTGARAAFGLADRYTSALGTQVVGRPACLLDGSGSTRRSRWLLIRDGELVASLHLSSDPREAAGGDALHARLLAGGVSFPHERPRSVPARAGDAALDLARAAPPAGLGRSLLAVAAVALALAASAGVAAVLGRRRARRPPPTP